MTRGRTRNTVYLGTAGVGDEHDVVNPDALRPPTAVEVLQRVLSRDGAQRSAATAQRELADPAKRLAGAAARYADSLHVAAEQNLGPDRLAALDRAAERILPGLTDHPAYPAPRAHLTLLAVDGHNAAGALVAARDRHGMHSTREAAVLHARLTAPPAHQAVERPLPWLPAIPAALAADPTWGPYLDRAAQHTRDLADHVSATARGWTTETAPGWAQPLQIAGPELLARLAV